ncbi:MAG: 16S rRNA (cytosine(1402)-N(4))-methyltransferase RsmH [Steroidobacteraceae bacterium]
MARSGEGVSHVPVMPAQVLMMLNVRPDGVYLDATFGRGGHAGAILGKLGAQGRLLCLDRDPAAIASAGPQFTADARVHLMQAPFSRLADCADRIEPALSFDGILFDLGVSSPQLDEAARGFSFSADGPLDMRMDPTHGASAADVVNQASEADLARIFAELGEERFARRIARAIVHDRREHPFRTTLELAGLIQRVAPTRERGKHPATRVFQALRIHVNRELPELRTALAAALSRLKVGGRIVVISFHSLEDRIVKRFFRDAASVDPVYAGLPGIPAHALPVLRLVGRSIEPDEAEIDRNPRARSARLRVAERLPRGLAA